jgi:predicted AlkP superfamily pyrophosphatase or phosphodiesterase
MKSTNRRSLPVALALLLAAAIVYLGWPVEVEVDAGERAAAPKLAVLVVFDQMRGDYPQRWEELYGEGGFKRLMKEGAHFTDCHYPYAYTLTAPGHTSLATGCAPDKHGIVANDWYSRAEAATVSCVTPPPIRERDGPGPYRRRQETVGDSLLGANKKARVVSVSIKPRAAILLAALRAQVCYWLHPLTGAFITSPYYRDEPHGWVKQFNAARPADVWLGKQWKKLRPTLDYAKYSGPDDFFGEGIGYEQGQTFPHPFVKGSNPKEPTYYDAVANSPAGDELLLAFAKRAIDAEALGQRDATDLLCISFSSNDLVGHCWGPDSQEVLDITLRSDAIMKELLDYLDAKVGKGRYVVAMTGDHGICPLPEFAQRQGKDAGRVPPQLLTSQSEAFLNKHFLKAGAKAPWLEMPKKSNPWVYFNRATIRELGLNEAQVQRALADWLAHQDGIQAAFTRTELMKEPLADPIGRAVQRSFDSDSSGDVMVVLKPYHIFSAPITSPKTATYRTTHGTPHPYDTHVPLIVMGPGIVPGSRGERITPLATASILSRALGVPAPPGAEAPVPAGLFRQ